MFSLGYPRRGHPRRNGSLDTYRKSLKDRLAAVSARVVSLQVSRGTFIAGAAKGGSRAGGGGGQPRWRRRWLEFYCRDWQPGVIDNYRRKKGPAIMGHPQYATTFPISSRERMALLRVVGRETRRSMATLSRHLSRPALPLSCFHLTTIIELLWIAGGPVVTNGGRAERYGNRENYGRGSRGGNPHRNCSQMFRGKCSRVIVLRGSSAIGNRGWMGLYNLAARSEDFSGGLQSSWRGFEYLFNGAELGGETSGARGSRFTMWLGWVSRVGDSGE